MLQIAHRGYSKKFKENTWLAFSKAIEHDFDMIELDLHRTLDGVVIIYHITLLHGKPLVEMSLSEILEKETVMLWTDFQLKMKDHTGMKVCVDIKTDDCRLCDQIIDTIPSIENYYLSSFHFGTLEYLYQKNPLFKLGFICDVGCTEEMWHWMFQRVPFRFVSIAWWLLHERLLSCLRNYDSLLLFSYTCSDASIFHFMNRFQLDGIFCNEPFHHLISNESKYLEAVSG